jgi:hypothetical protein
VAQADQAELISRIPYETGILMNVHPVLRGDAEASQLQLPRSEPEGQPDESPQLAGARAADLAPIIADVRASGMTSLRQIAAGLNGRGIPAARGGAWSAVQVKRVLERRVSPAA